MNDKRMLCLCPTYGRHPSLINNTIALFERQTHENRFLLIYDDGGTYHQAEGDRWKLVSVPKSERIWPLPHKYNAMWHIGDRYYNGWEAAVVWEDDDIYLPHHLEANADALAEHAFAYPTHVLSTYGGTLNKEKTGGRFHASLVVSRGELHAGGGWVETDRSNFDQQFIKKLQERSRPGRPTDCKENPSYVFRWGDTGHRHHECALDENDKTKSVYEDYPVQFPPPEGEKWSVCPELDESSKGVFKELGLPI